jgi:hypothetical protein
MREASLFGSKWEQRYFIVEGNELCHSSKLSNLTTGDLHSTKRINAHVCNMLLAQRAIDEVRLERGMRSQKRLRF